MTNPKTTIPGYLMLIATFLGTLGQLLPSRYSQYVTLAAVAAGGAAGAIGHIHAQDGSP